MRRLPAALRDMLAAYDPAIARSFYAARKAVLEAAPDANELIYDAYNAVAVAYSFSDRLKDAFCHVAAYAKHVNLGFNQGASLPDPERLLAGSGARIRHVRVAAVADPQTPGVRKLVHAAVERGQIAKTAVASKPRAVVKAVYGKKRRPAKR
jgi:hypothetical protein